MSLIITVLAILGSPLIYLLVRFANRKQWAAFAVTLFLVVGGAVFLFRPVCVPIENGEEDAKKYNYEQREDKNFYVKVFQKKDGQWHHCKTWIGRQFFF
jgi:hypothetical protein